MRDVIFLVRYYVVYMQDLICQTILELIVLFLVSSYLECIDKLDGFTFQYNLIVSSIHKNFGIIDHLGNMSQLLYFCTTLSESALLNALSDQPIYVAIDASVLTSNFDTSHIYILFVLRYSH